jgi:hypothetical protein
VQVIKFLIRKGKYLDFLFDAEGAKLLAQDLVGLLEGLWTERSADMHKFGEEGSRISLCLTLGNDDFIDIKSTSISLILDRETCDYAATKLKTFVATGSMFPAELQSFESVESRGNIMVYFFAADSYGANT